VKKRIVVFYWHPPGPPMRAGVLAHLRSLESIDGAEVLFVNAYSPRRRLLAQLEPDAMVFHNTFLCMRWSHLFPSWKWELRWIADADGPKIALPQDEYDHAHVLDEWLYELGVTSVVSNFDPSLGEILYPVTSGFARFHKRFTGYVDEATARRIADRIVPLQERQVDIVYRATRLPYWFGSHGQLKHRIGSVVADAATRHGLSTDVSTRGEDTIVGDSWFDFLMSGRVVIGCESGSSVLDRRGEVRAAIQDLLRDDPARTFEEVDARMPAGWDDHAFFALSPRHFEAVVTKTPQVLVEGAYDGVLEPNRHYLPVARDLSDLDDVLEKVKDTDRLAEIAECAYDEIYLGGRYSYQALSGLVEQIVDEADHPRGRRVAISWPLLRARQHAARKAEFVTATLLPQVQVRVWRPRRGEVARVVAALQSARRHPALRTLIAESARCTPRPSARRLAADVVRLDLLAAAEAGTSVGPRFGVEPIIHDSTLILRSRQRPLEDTRNAMVAALAAVGAGEVEHFEWDHRAVGMCVPYPLGPRRLSMSIGEMGVYSFTSLAAVASRDPRIAEEVIRRVLGVEPGAHEDRRYDAEAPADAPVTRSTTRSSDRRATTYIEARPDK
jgi:hypothetical protein